MQVIVHKDFFRLLQAHISRSRKKAKALIYIYIYGLYLKKSAKYELFVHFVRLRRVHPLRTEFAETVEIKRKSPEITRDFSKFPLLGLQ